MQDPISDSARDLRQRKARFPTTHLISNNAPYFRQCKAQFPTMQAPWACIQMHAPSPYTADPDLFACTDSQGIISLYVDMGELVTKQTSAHFCPDHLGLSFLEGTHKWWFSFWCPLKAITKEDSLKKTHPFPFDTFGSRHEKVPNHWQQDGPLRARGLNATHAYHGQSALRNSLALTPEGGPFAFGHKHVHCSKDLGKAKTKQIGKNKIIPGKKSVSPEPPCQPGLPRPGALV